MPDLTFTITVKDNGTAVVQQFGQNVVKTARQTRSVLGRMSVGFGRLGASINRLPSAILNVRNAMAGLAVGLVIKKVAQTFADFESRMNRVQAITKATGEEFKQMNDLALEMGRTTIFTAGQAAEAMSLFAVAGFDTAEIIGALPDTLNLAAAGQVDLARATDITAGVMRGMGLDVSELSRANDVLVKTFTSSKVTIDTLGESFKFVGPIARSAGIEFEEVSAIMGLLGDANIDASMAGTTLRGAITKLLNPADEAAAILKDVGVQVTDASGRMRPMADILEDLAPLANDTGALMKIFGQRAGPGMAALLGVGSDRLREFTEELRNSGGEAQRVAEKQLEGLRGAWILMTSALDGVANTIGDAVAPALTKIVNFIRNLSGNLTEAVNVIKQVSGSMKGVLDVGFGEFLESITPSVETIVGAFFRFIEVILALQSAWIKLKRFVLGFTLVANDAARIITIGFLKVVEAVTRVWDGLTKVVGAAIGFILDQIVKLTSGLANALEELPIEKAQKFRRALFEASTGMNQLAESVEEGVDSSGALVAITEKQNAVNETFAKRLRDTANAVNDLDEQEKKLQERFSKLQTARALANRQIKENREELLRAGDAAEQVAQKAKAAADIIATPPPTPTVDLFAKLLPEETLEQRVSRLAGLLRKMNQDTAVAIVNTAKAVEGGLEKQLEAVDKMVNREIALQHGKAALMGQLFGPGGLVNNLMESGSEEAFRIAQAMQIGQAVMAAFTAINTALGAPFPLNLILPPIIAANAFANVAQIASQKPTRSAGGAAAGGGGIAVPTAMGAGRAPVETAEVPGGGGEVNVIVQGFVGNEAKLASELGKIIRDARGDGVRLETL